MSRLNQQDIAFKIKIQLQQVNYSLLRLIKCKNTDPMEEGVKVWLFNKNTKTWQSMKTFKYIIQ